MEKKIIERKRKNNMKKGIMLKTMWIYAIVFLTSYITVGAETGDFNSVNSNRFPEILNMISTRVRNNYEGIKTWEGQVNVKKNYIYEGARAEKVFKEDTENKGEIPRIIKEQRETIIEFSLDAERGFLYENYYPIKPLEYTDIETGRELGAKGILSSGRAILTPEYQVDCTGYMRRDNVIIKRRAVKQARPKNCLKCDSNMHPIYDPRTSFNKGFKDQIWELFHDLLEIIEKDGKYSIDQHELKVEEFSTGDITEYRVTMPSRVGSRENYQYAYSTMIFNSDKGYNITSYKYTVDNIVVRNNTWDYELIDGIYVPIKTNQKDFNWPDGVLRYESIVTFKNQNINIPIAIDTFTFKNLGLKNGDEYIDNIDKKTYKYQDAKLVFISDLSAGAEPNN